MQIVLAGKGGYFLAAEVAPCPGLGLALHLRINGRCPQKLAAKDTAWFDYSPGLTKIVQDHVPVRDVLKHDVGVYEVETIVGEHAEAGVRRNVHESVRDILQLIPSAMLSVAVNPRFHAGQRVRARNMHPVSHTRLPRYARGRTGVIERDRGVQAFPDTNVMSRGEHPQHVYSVRFTARELWGERASPRDAVFIDMWEDYLEPV